MTMPDEAAALRLIKEAGHAVAPEYREWGDMPCCGPVCIKCGDCWCLWENYLEVEVCDAL